MSTSTAPKKLEKKYIHYAVVFFFAFFFRFIPPFGAVTPYGMGIIGCFLAVIYGWSTIDMFGPSLIALIGLGLSIGFMPLITGAFGNITVAGMFFVFMVMGVAIEVGGIDWMVNRLLHSKLFIGKSWFTCWFFLIFMLHFRKFRCYLSGFGYLSIFQQYA